MLSNANPRLPRCLRRCIYLPDFENTLPVGSSNSPAGFLERIHFNCRGSIVFISHHYASAAARTSIAGPAQLDQHDRPAQRSLHDGKLD